MAEQRTKIIIETDAGRSEQVLRSVQKGLQGVGTEAGKAGQSVTAGAGMMDSALSTTAMAAVAMGAAFKSAYAMAKDASALAESRQSLQTYAAEIGVSFEKLIKASKESSGRQVDDLKLIQLNHKTLKNGVSRDIDDIARLWEVSAALGDDYGKSIDEMYSTITDAITTGNGKALLSMGLLPDSFKKASNAGALLERRAELLKIVLEQAGVGADSLAKNGDTAADKFDRFEVAATNLKKALGEGLLPIVTPIVEGLTSIADTAGIVIQKFAQLADMSGSGNQFLGKTIEELEALRAEAANRVGSAGSKLNALTDPSQSYRRGNNSDATTSIMAAEVQYQGELTILKQIDDTLEKLKERTEARTVADAKAAAARQALTEKEKAADDLKKKALEAEKQATKELEEAQKNFNKAQAETSKLLTQSSEAFLNGFGVKSIKNLEEAESLLTSMTAAAGGFAVGLKDGTTEAGKLLEEAEKVSKKFEDINADIAGTIAGAGKNWSKDLANLTPSMAVNGMLSRYSGGIWGAGEEPKLDKIEESLSETIAEAVQTGFANADFSDLSMTLGSILTSVLSKSIAQSNPVMDASGAINWGNLGANIGVSFATKAITGLFTTKEKNKEAIQQAATIQDKTANAYMDSFETMIGAVYASPEYKNRLKEAQKSFWGAKIGYSWDKDWSWSDLSYVKEYQVNDMGASAAYKKITEAADNMQTASDNYESELNLKSAQGYDYAVLSAKIDAYKQSLQSVTMGRPQTIWNGTEYKSENLNVLTNEVRSELETMIRELGLATADRSNAVASGFAKYAPWLEEIFIKSSGNNMLNSVMPGITGYSANVSSLSRDQYFDAYEGMQTDFADRNISPELLNMVKQSGSGKYELEKLRVTGSDDYAEKYLEYVEKQVSAYEEVLERQEEIFSDAARTFEERSAALATYEAAQESYYQAKLDALAAEQAAEAAIKQKQQEADLRKAEGMEAALSLVGEVAQRGDRIVILQGGDSTTALKELLEKFSDDPEVSAILQAAITNNEAKARWGN